ncbi:sugar ABC transporter substrate-binding protein [Atrimonas thermophila]
MILPLICSCVAFGEDELAAFKEAKIDWRQFEGTAISVLSIPHAYGLALEPYIPEFEKLTGIRVNLEFLGEDELRRKRTIDLSMGTGLYDVMSVGLSIIPQYAQAGWLADLKPYISNPLLTDDAWYNYEGIGAPFRKWNTTEDGRVMAIPGNFSGPIFWYRTDIFDKYGFVPPDTWEELIDLKKKLQEKLDADPEYQNVYAFCTRGWTGPGANTWTICPVIYDYGGRIFDENMKAVFNSTEAVKALEVYREAQVGYGNPPGSEGIDMYTMVDMFAAGNLASMFAGIDHIVFIGDPQKSKVVDVWDASIPPRGPAGRYSSLWTWSFGINYASRHKEPAWLFVQWATSKPVQERMGPLGTPTRLELWTTEPFQKLKQKGWIKAAMWYVENGTVTEPLIPEFREVGEAMSVAFSKILRGEPIKESLDEAVAKVDEIIAKRREVLREE